MPAEIAVALIESAPMYLALLTILILGIVYRDVVRKRILPRVGGVKMFGFEITLLKESLDHAAAASSAEVARATNGVRCSARNTFDPSFQALVFCG